VSADDIFQKFYEATQAKIGAASRMVALGDDLRSELRQLRETLTLHSAAIEGIGAVLAEFAAVPAEIEAETHDVVTRLSEKATAADIVMRRLDDRAVELERLGDFHRASKASVATLRGDLAGLASELHGVARDLEFERGERVENHRKLMRSIQAVADLKEKR